LNILIVKMSAIGDVTHTLPVLSALRRHYPHAHIAWLVEEAAAEVVRAHKALDRMLVWHRASSIKQFHTGNKFAVVREIRRLAKELRDSRYDLLIDCHALLKSSLWVGLARADCKAGFGRGMEHSEGSYLFLNKRIPAVSMEVHALDRGLVLLNALGIPTPEVVYDFPILESNQAEAFSLFEAGGLKAGDPIVAVHPMTLWPTKLWENERFGQVADRLIEKGYRVVFTGGTGDRGAIDDICRSMTGRPIRLDGRTSLKTLAAVYRMACTVVSTDTGPMHIAAAVGTPVVALFGPTAPWRTGPYGKEHTVLRTALTCNPCFRRLCLTGRYEEMACMRRITVDQVVDAVTRTVHRRIPTRTSPNGPNAPQDLAHPYS
jgi:lipopolysaccharide heptosyltransferase I